MLKKVEYADLAWHVEHADLTQYHNVSVQLDMLSVEHREKRSVLF